MAHALPSSGALPDAAPTCDTDDMRVVHGLLRHLLADAADRVRSVRPAQPRRRTAVARHAAMASAVLAGHHDTEDDLLWGDLEQRAPACALHVARMRSQHAAMASLLTGLDDAIVRWEAGAATATEVAAHLDDVLDALVAHLGDEEESILPVAALVLSQGEWDRLGAAGGDKTPQGMRLVLLGSLLRSIPDAQRDDWMRASLPLPARVLWVVVGRRAFARHERAMEVDA